MIELMISITIGLLILAGLVTVFANASNTQNELRRSAQQIENGRYAIDVLTQDLQLAGFWGQYRNYTAPAALPDPCDLSTGNLTTAIGLPVQGYAAASLTAAASPPGSCSTWLPAANLAAGSDILVVRRANTERVTVEIAGTTTAAGEAYLQANASNIEVQSGPGAVNCTSTATGAAATISRRCAVPASSDFCASTCTGGGTPAGNLRKYEVHIYFVAPCNVPAGGGSICTGANDDNGQPIPTLKRLELSGGTFTVVPLAEGVEYMTISYGIDDTSVAGTNVANADTGLVGDGAPDRNAHAPSLADFGNAVTARVDLLVRNPEPSPGYTDSKTYNLGIADGAAAGPLYNTVTPAKTQYRRHVYSSLVRLVNLNGRKEIP